MRTYACVIWWLSVAIAAEERILYRQDFEHGKPGDSLVASTPWRTGDKDNNLFLSADGSGNVFLDGSTNVPEEQGASSVPFFSVQLTQQPKPGAGRYVVLEARLRGGPGPKPELTSTSNSSLWLTGESSGYDGVIARWHYCSQISRPPAPAWTFITGRDAVLAGQKEEPFPQKSAIGEWVRALVVVDLEQRTAQGMIRAGKQDIVTKMYRTAVGFDLWRIGHLVIRQDTRNGKFGLDVDDLLVRQTDENPIPANRRGKAVAIEEPETGAAAPTVGKPLEPTDEVVSPHIKWAANAEPLRVLFITSTRSLREVIEICQRFNVQRDVFAMLTPRAFGSANRRLRKLLPGASPGDAALRLHQKLARKHDVFVIGNIYWTALPDWSRKAILARVENGAGLVLHVRGEWGADLTEALSHRIDEDPRTVLSAYPFVGLPAYRSFGTFEHFAGETLLLAQHGKGRVALIRGRAPAGAASALWASRGVGEGVRVPARQMLTSEAIDAFPHLYLTHYDYYLAKVGHLLRWVGRVERPVRVHQPPIAVQTPARERWEPIRVTLSAENKQRVQLEYVLRDAAMGRSSGNGSADLTLSAGLNNVTLDLPAVAAGNYFLDIWVTQGDRTLDYGSVYLAVESDKRITDLTLSAQSFSIHEPVRGSLTTNAGARMAIHVSQWDNLGRCTSRLRIDLADGTKEHAFSLTCPRPHTVLQRVETRLLDAEGAELDCQHTFFTYRDLFPPRDDVRAIVAQGSRDSSYLDVTHARALAALGFDTRMTAGGWSVHSCEALEGTPLHRWVRPRKRVDRKFLHYGAALLANLRDMISIYDGVDGDYDWHVEPRGRYVDGTRGPMRRPCLTNPGHQRKVLNFYSSEARRLRHLGVSEYNLGDECAFLATKDNVDVCFSDTCIRDLQSYLRATYGTVERLNRQYGSKYRSFDDVIPVPFEKAKATGQVSLWVDHRRHMEQVWAGYFERARAAIEPQAPGALVGYEGSDEPGHIYADRVGGAEDYYRLAKAMTMNGTYYFPLQLDCVRDFSAPGTLIGGGWFGGYAARWRAGRDARHHRWWIWNTLLRGANSLWVYTGNAMMQTDGYFSIIASDLSPLEFFRATAKEIQIAKSGIGKLLMSAPRPHDGIAVLYSPSSMLLSAFDDRMPGRWDSAAAVPYVLTEAGFQYRMIYPDQLAAGVLTKGDFRLLYLPYCQALSQAEIAAILTFAKAGGVVLADLRPGVADGHGKAYGTGALDALFGVTQTTARAQPIRAAITSTDGRIDLPPARGDASLKLNGAVAAARIGAAPAVVTHRLGRGLGILLNFAAGDLLVGNLSYDVSFTNSKTANEIRSLVRRLLGGHGITPSVTVEPHLPGCHVFRRSLADDGDLLGVVWDAPSFLPGIRCYEDTKVAEAAKWKRSVWVKLPSSRHVYSVFAGRYVGFTDTVPSTLQPGDTELFATLPYRVEAMTISAPTALRQGDELQVAAALKTDGGAPGLHAFRLELTAPSGQTTSHYCRNLTAPAGRAKTALTLALNEATGRWKLTVRDVTTGVSAETSLDVAPKRRQ